MKTCTTCKSALPLDAFYRDARKADGLYPACRECHGKRAKAWRGRNQAKVVENATRYNREYYASRRLELCERATAWSRNNRDRVNARNRATGSGVIRSQRHRGLVLGAPGSGMDAAEWHSILSAHDHRCAYCLGQFASLDVEHVIPLSRGGAHDASNIVPACESCNASKGARGPVDLLLQPQLLVMRRMFPSPAAVAA